jgi:NitT/TauT family transport system substrate-binding protein
VNQQAKAFTFAVSIIVALITGSAPETAVGADLIPVKISYGSPWVGYAPIFIAQEMGYFRDEGLAVEFIYVAYNNPQEAADELAAKRVDAHTFPLDESTLFWKPEVPYATIFSTDISFGGDGILVRKDLHIASVADLKGKRVAAQATTPSHFLLNYLLKQAGLSEADITFVNMKAKDAAAAVGAGKVDAAVSWSPFLTQALGDPNVALLVSTRNTPPILVDAIVMNKDLITSSPDVCKGLVRAWNKAVAYQKTKPDESLAIMARGLHQAPEEVKADLPGMVLFGKEENARLFEGSGPGTARGVAAFAIDLWTQVGLLKKPVRADDLIDDRCLEK